MNGDILTDLDLGEFYEKAVTTPAALTAVTTEVEWTSPFGEVRGTGDRIDLVDEKPVRRVEILAGIYLLELSALAAVPRDTLYGIDQLITELVTRGLDVRRSLTRRYWRDIGRPADYEAAAKEYAERFGHLGIRTVGDANAAA
ncbi:MAG: hypothetical protein GKS06_08275 [Acidobacteria bacterium]|nr:hypothetical protein [Acidobacteriota bacterium]